MRVTRLRCEHREDMPCIDSRAPRLSWTLEADGRDSARARYRILVRRARRARHRAWHAVGQRARRVLAHGRRRLRRAAAARASELAWTVQVWDETGAPVRLERARALPHRASPRGAPSGSGATRPTARVDARPGRPARTRRERRACCGRLPPATHLRRPFAIDGAGAARHAVRHGARRWSSSSSTARASATRVLSPGWTDYRRADRVRRPRRHRARCARATTCSARSSATAGTPACVGMDRRARPGNHYGARARAAVRAAPRARGRQPRASSRSDERWTRRRTARSSTRDLLMGERYDARRELGAGRAGLPTTLRPVATTRATTSGSCPSARSRCA